ncbi:MAG: hypothetical protein HY288_00210 [Planctomycetia bacterium]|nr:hypothetical protein [Planctomycetia bacterium]
MQWLVLRQHFRQAWWWVLGSTLAGPIVAYGVIHPVTLVIVTWEHGGVGLLLTWVMTGPITGAALLWLLRSRLSKSIAAA